MATTETTPFAPTDIIGSVSGSSPERIVMSQSSAISLTWSTEPLASLIATMFSISESLATVSGSMFTPVRDGTL